MRIAQVATCSGPVREDQTGSVESLIWLLTRELTAMGHEVTVFGCAGSQVHGELVVTHPGSYGAGGTPSDWQLCDWMSLAAAVDQSHRFDVIHSHAYLWGLALERFSKAPMVHTMHTCPYEDEALLWDRFPDTRITAVSAFQWSQATTRAPCAIVHHGVDPARYAFSDSPQDYLCYLGRFIPGKGPLEAVRIARKLSIPLLLAGPENEYFSSTIRPHVDGRLIHYAGAVDHAARNALLAGAKALLYPLTQPEPFGLVQIEAMMCGTPVVGTKIGAIPEIVAHGVTGCLATTVDGLLDAVASATALPRAPIRHEAESRFSSSRMSSGYLSVYEHVSGARGVSDVR